MSRSRLLVPPRQQDSPIRGLPPPSKRASAPRRSVTAPGPVACFLPERPGRPTIGLLTQSRQHHQPRYKVTIQLNRRHQQPLQAAAHFSDSAATSRSEEHTSELQSLMRISYAVFCLKKKKN